MSISEKRLMIAFIQGAKWWEWKKTGGTMWPSDEDVAGSEAAKLIKAGHLGETYDEYIHRIENCTHDS